MALFDYGNTRLRARLSNIQPFEKMESLADLTSIDSFLSALTKTPYKESIETALTYAHGYSCLSQAMRMELVNIAADLNRFYQDAEAKLVRIIFMRDDLLNLKTIVRGLTHEIPLDEMEDSFLSLGTIPLAYLNELAKAKNLDDAVNKMVVYQLPAAQVLMKLRTEKEPLSSSEINLVLEKWYFHKIKELLKGSSENILLLQEFYAIEADITNLNTILRMVNSPDGFENSNIKEFLIAQGNISHKVLLKLSKSGSVEEVIRPLLTTKYSVYLKRGLGYYAESRHLSEFENQMRIYMLNWLVKLPRLYPLGIGVPLGYYGRKRIEIRNLRWIGKGISSGFEARYIKDNLVRIQ
ncbi:MAG: V-type ATPase subunit [Pelolinea sp.]|nr:V-type ATPase subunit [Pelolinea sp.]